MYDPEYVAARRALLDALEALGGQRQALVLVGAQAIYLHTGAGTLAVAEYTTDADIAVDPRLLLPLPGLAEAMERAGFFLDTLQGAVGIWSLRQVVAGIPAIRGDERSGLQVRRVGGRPGGHVIGQAKRSQQSPGPARYPVAGSLRSQACPHEPSPQGGQGQIGRLRAGVIRGRTRGCTMGRGRGRDAGRPRQDGRPQHRVGNEHPLELPLTNDRELRVPQTVRAERLRDLLRRRGLAVKQEGFRPVLIETPRHRDQPRGYVVASLARRFAAAAISRLRLSAGRRLVIQNEVDHRLLGSAFELLRLL